MENLAFYDVENAEAPISLDLGEAAPSSSDDIMLRVVNKSDSYQAEDVIVAVTGPDAIQLYLSSDGDVYGTSLLVGDIPPGGSSNTFWLRRVTPSTATGSCTASLTATPASWSSPVDTSTSGNVFIGTED